MAAEPKGHPEPGLTLAPQVDVGGAATTVPNPESLQAPTAGSQACQLDPLAQRIANRIQSQGPIRTSDFVEAALYDPEEGFYTTRRAGRRGDYITAPEVGPLFGEVIARALQCWWVDTGRPASFDVVEIGAGTGALARSVLASAVPVAQVMRWWLVESSAYQRGLHARRFTKLDADSKFGTERDLCLYGSGAAETAEFPTADHPDGQRQQGPIYVSVERLEQVTGSAAVVLFNEMLDNCSFEIIEHSDGFWREVLVALDDNGCFIESLGAVVDRPDVTGEQGARIPLHHAGVELLQRVRRRHRHARIVVFDYAAPTSELIRRSPHWLRTYAGHRRDHDWLTNPGSRDITCDLAIEQIAATFDDAPEITSQARWLKRYGIDDLVSEGKHIWMQRAGVADLAAIKARSRVSEAEALLDPTGLGGFTVFEWVGTH